MTILAARASHTSMRKPKRLNANLNKALVSYVTAASAASGAILLRIKRQRPLPLWASWLKAPAACQRGVQPNLRTQNDLTSEYS